MTKEQHKKFTEWLKMNYVYEANYLNMLDPMSKEHKKQEEVVIMLKERINERTDA